MLLPPRGSRALTSAAAVVLGLAAPAAAQDVADFYRGKTVSILMGTGPGGSYDLYGRTIAEHLGRNHIYGTAPQDGTKILLSHALPLVEKLEGGPGIRFESGKFNWLGTYDAIAQVLTFWHTARASGIDDMKGKDFVVGSFNKTHLTYQWAMLAKSTLGTKYKVITGYPSGNHLNLAMERGEIHGWVASWANLTGTKPDWLKDKKIDLTVQFTLERHRDLPQVPTLLELAPADKKDVVEFLTAGTPFARGLAVGPTVPADRVAALRTAFDALMKDPAFLAEAQKRKLDIDPRNAAQAHAMVDKIAGASPELIARVKQAIGQE
jgi:tripartite-type tricarboxylate transporter receptor subunit TctC